jgi:hypothetical protein
MSATTWAAADGAADAGAARPGTQAVAANATARRAALIVRIGEAMGFLSGSSSKP